jgi:uncharacterized protein YndB with AHSA1/START domain
VADIVHKIGIKKPAAEVYKALTTIEGLAGWWTELTKGDAKPGGKITFTFKNPKGEVMGEMLFKVTETTPAKRVAWKCEEGPPEWLGTQVTFDIKEEDGMTIVIFGHRGWKEQVEFYAHCSMKWAVFLLSLRDLAEKGKGSPAPRDLKIDNWN